MEDYLNFFLFKESLIQEYAPNYNRHLILSHLELVETYNGPFKMEKDLVEYVEALKWVLNQHGIPQSNLSDLIFFSTLIYDFIWKFEFQSSEEQLLTGRENFLSELSRLPLGLMANNGYISMEQPFNDYSHEIVEVEESRVNQKDSKERQKAFIKNYYYNRRTGKSLINANYQEIEISRDIQIAITSTLRKGKSVVIPDENLRKKIIDVIIETIIQHRNNASTTDEKVIKRRTRVISRPVIAYISNLILRYINKNKLIKPVANGKLSNDQGEFLFDYFSILGWINEKRDYKELSGKVAPGEKNPLIRKCRILRRQYRSTKGDGMKSTANHIREIIKSNSL